MYRILSLSGGGFLGYFTVSVLDELCKLRNKNIDGVTDFYAGTSIGGIVSLGLAAGLAPSELKEKFVAHRHDIFSGVGWRMAFSRYRQKSLRHAMTQILGKDIINTSIGNLPKDVMVTAVRYDTAESVLISSINDETSGWSVIDAALATSAAPTYFPAHMVDGVRYLDGGMCANVPDMAALHHVIKYKSKQRKDIRMLSIGTTYSASSVVKYRKLGRYAGGMRWATNVVPFVMDAQRNLISEEQCMLAFKKKQYVRLDQTVNEQLALDSTSDDTIDVLDKAVKKCIERQGNCSEVMSYFA